MRGLILSHLQGLKEVLLHFAVFWIFVLVAADSQVREWSVVQEAVKREPAVVIRQ